MLRHFLLNEIVYRLEGFVDGNVVVTRIEQIAAHAHDFCFDHHSIEHEIELDVGGRRSRQRENGWRSKRQYSLRQP